MYLALAGHRAILREGEGDFLAEAEAVLAPKKKTAAPANALSSKSAKSQPALTSKRSKS